MFDWWQKLIVGRSPLPPLRRGVKIDNPLRKGVKIDNPLRKGVKIDNPLRKGVKIDNFLKREVNVEFPFKRGVILLFLLLMGSGILGWGMAGAMATPLQIAQIAQIAQTNAPNPSNPSNAIESPNQRSILETITNSPTTDIIPKRYEQSLQIYLANCSTCHLAIPAEVLPRQTWQRLLENTNQHYTAQLPLISGVEINLMWNYLGTFAKNASLEDRIPFLVRDSRFFRALHPRIRFSESVKVGTCISCHPRAAEFNFRRLQES